MLHRLTEDNIRNGCLSDDDFSAAAGFRVVSFDLAQFPHFDELRAQGSLSRHKLHERADAIYQALDDTGQTYPMGEFDKADALSVAGEPRATLQSAIRPIELSSVPHFNHFQQVHSQGFDLAHEEGSPVWRSAAFSDCASVADVLPGLLSEDVPVLGYFRRCAAFILRPTTLTPQAFWAQRARMSESLLVRVPQDGALALLADLHERRHLQQIIIKSSSRSPQFYSELDADLAPDASLRRANVGAETREANLHARYIGMLAAPPTYWFAPTMEALARREKPKDYFRTFRAVMEVRLRLALPRSGSGVQRLSSEQIQNAVGAWKGHKSVTARDELPVREVDALDRNYVGLSQRLLRSDPALLHTRLRQLVEDGVFTDPFAERIACGIVRAAAYFNPDLVQADQVPARKRLNDLMWREKACCL